MSEAEKRYREIDALLRNHNVHLEHYVETGVRDGALISLFEKDGWTISGIEMDAAQHAIAAAKLNSAIVLADSAQVIWSVCQTITRPALFFLDAHWWGGYAECAESDLPLLSELAAIRSRPYADFVVIDDAQMIGITREQCRQRKVDVGWAGVTRRTVQTALGKSRIRDKGYVSKTKPPRMWISLYGEE